VKETVGKGTLLQKLVLLIFSGAIFARKFLSLFQKIKEAAASDNPDQAAFDPALKEVRRLLENDQFPRFRRSDLYIGFLEKLLPLAYAQKWTSSFDALLGNQVMGGQWN
jgi:hypothetical protein